MSMPIEPNTPKWIAALLDGDTAAMLAGQVIDHRCEECDGIVTTEADWKKRPVCCGAEMIDQPWSIRPADDA